MKFEIVITAWDDDLFVKRESKRVNDIDNYIEEIIEFLTRVKDEAYEKVNSRPIVDDDIPF